MVRRTRIAGIAAVLVAAVLALSACSSKHPGYSENGTRIVDPNAAFTAPTLQDWKDLGDAVAAVEITGERKDPGTTADPAGTSGVYGRLIDVQVLHVYWQRGPAFTPPATFTTNGWGWVSHGNTLQPIVARGEPRLDPNHVYLLALAKFKTGWAGLGSGAEVPFDGGQVGYGEWEGRDKNIKQPALEELMGKDAAGVQAALDQTQPSAQSAKYDDLDPIQRAKKLGKAHS
jgi:hypothetical protein